LGPYKTRTDFYTDIMDLKNFGKQLSTLRKKAGLTQKQLASEIFV